MKNEILKRCIENFWTINDYELAYNDLNESRDISVQNLIYDGIFENSIEGIIELYKKDGKNYTDFSLFFIMDVYKKDIREVIDELFKKLDRVMI